MLRIDLRVLLMGLAVLIIILWAVASYQPRPAVVVTPIRVNQTAPPQTPTSQPPGAVATGLFLCPGDAYKWRNVIVCNPAQVLDSYVLIQRGWIYAPKATLRLQGDISTCTLRLGVSTLYIDCAQPVILVKT
jgi:hypothetical protein